MPEATASSGTGADMAKKRGDQQRGTKKTRKAQKPIRGFPTDAQLKSALKGKSTELRPEEALSVLLTHTKEGAALARSIAKDAKQELALRTTATVALGRDPSVTNRTLLKHLLRAGDGPVVRRAAQGLGRIGDESALKALRSAKPTDAVVKRAVDTAKTLLSYRLGARSSRIPTPEARDVLVLGKARARAFDVTPLTDAAFQALTTLKTELPGVPTTKAGACTLDCGRGNYLVVFNREVAKKQGFARLMDTSAVMGAVLKRSDIDGRYFLDSYLLTHPGRGATARLFVMRASGAVTYHGELKSNEGGLSFSVAALNTRYSYPVELEGQIAASTLEVNFGKALVGTGRGRAQAPPKRPRKMAVRI